MQRNGFRGTVPLSGIGSPWFGRSSTLLENYLWLVIAFLTGCVPPPDAVTWIAVPRPRARTAGGLVLMTLRISSTLADIAGWAVAGPVNALLNVRRALGRVVVSLLQGRSQAPQMRFGGRWHDTGMPAPGTTPHQGHPMDGRIERNQWAWIGPDNGSSRKIAATAGKARIPRSTPPPEPQNTDRAHLNRQPPTFSGASN